MLQRRGHRDEDLVVDDHVFVRGHLREILKLKSEATIVDALDLREEMGIVADKPRAGPAK
jgi:hypothetical protein